MRRLAFRVGRLAATVVAVSILTFYLTTRLPGDASVAVLGEAGLDGDARERMRESMGLNDGFWQRYADWFGGVLTGDLGHSFTTNAPVADGLTRALPVTLELIAMTIVLSVLLAIPVAMTQARFRDRWQDRAGTTLTFVILSTPPFVMSLMLILVFAVGLQALPASGWVPLSESVTGNLQAMVLPTATLALTQLAVFSRILRGDLITTLDQDFISLARSKGISTRKVLYGHALRSSSFSLVTVVGLQIGLLLGGTVIAEQVFALPGVGSLLVDAVNSRDLVTVQAIALLAAVGFVVINFLVDLVYTTLDPRIRYGS